MNLKAFLIFISLGFITYFTPIQGLIYFLIAVIILDLITAIIKNIKVNKIKGFLDVIKSIKSRKLRRTAIKMFLYLTFVMIIYVFNMECFNIDLYLANIATAFLGFTELTSIAENMDIVTEKNVFTSIIVKIRKKIEKFLSDKIEL